MKTKKNLRNRTTEEIERNADRQLTNKKGTQIDSRLDENADGWRHEEITRKNTKNIR